MKKTLLLLLVLLATASMTFAQDIWSCGTHDNGSYTGVGVYKNGERVHTLQSSYDFSSRDITRWNGHTWLAYRNNTTNVAWVLDHENSSTISFGDDSYVYKLFGRNYLWAVGSKKNGSVYNATVWDITSGTASVEYTFDNGSYNTYAYCGLLDPSGWLYAGGCQYTSSGYEGVVWKGGTGVIYTFPASSYVYDMAYYDGHLYSLVCDNSSNKELWVYQDGTLKYTLVTGTSFSGNDMYIDGGDIYVCGWEGSNLKVWKNGGVLYSQSSSGSNYTGVSANSEGVFYCGNIGGTQGKIWKDGAVIYEPSNCKTMNKLYVETPECADADIRTLPFSEGFETGETNWECWTKIDSDNNNSNYASYWARNGKCNAITSTMPHTGDHYARHTHRPLAGNQEGWLVTPRLFLQPGRDQTYLTFYSYVGWTYASGFASVLVSTDSDPTNLSGYAEVYSLPSSSSTWTERVVDLKDYQGYAVYIAFKYDCDGSTSAPSWNIDDVEIYENWGECGAYSVPFVEEFDSEIESCWYIIDADHTGGNRCWQYNSSYNCAYHKFGQDNGIQQQGALFSPKIDLTTGSHFKLSFYYKNSDTSYGSDKANRLWIAVDEAGVPDPSHYTTKLWEDTDFPDSWTLAQIDLTPYAGHEVTLAFEYQGTYAHNWFIDDVTVEESTIYYDINVNSNNTAWGTASGGGTFEEGETVTIHATPASGYEFVKWTKGGMEVSTNADYTFTVTESATYTAVFGEPAVTYYTVSTAVNPAGSGTVTGGGTFASGTPITLVANPVEGWHFVKWQDNNTDNPRDITVSANETYTATFEKNQYTITLNASPTEGGTVTGGGTFIFGTNIQLMATAADGYEFVNWNDGVASRVRFVTVVEDAEYTAYFMAVGATTYTITALSNDPTLGEVTGGGTFPEGVNATLTATPIGSAVFQKWDDGNTDNPRVVTVNGDATYTAIFVMPTMYTITVESMNPEMGTVMGGGTFAMGTEVTIQAFPKGGYYFDGWNDGNHDNPRVVTVTGNATYKAKFSAQQSQTYTLTVMCNASEGAVTGNGTYAAGTTVTVQAIPYDGYKFDHWNDGVTENPRTVTVNDNMTLVAFFAKTGVNEYGERVLSVYPNPAKESIRIEGLEANAEVRIYNALGMLVRTVTVTGDEEIGLEGLSSGLYLIRSGHQTLRFVKE